MPFASEKQRRGFFAGIGSSGSILKDREQKKAIPQHERKSAVKRFLAFNKLEKDRAGEDEAVKKVQQKEKDRQRQEKIELLQESQEQEELTKKANRELKQGHITLEQYKKILRGEDPLTELQSATPKESQGAAIIRQNALIKKSQEQKNNELERLRDQRELLQQEREELERDKNNPNKSLKDSDYETQKERLQNIGRVNAKKSIGLKEDVADLQREKAETNIIKVDGQKRENVINKDAFGVIRGNTSIIDAKLEARKRSKARDEARFRNPSPIFPEGSEHRRRNPFTGKPTSRLLKKELLQNPNFVGFDEDKEPIFLKPDDEEFKNRLDFSAKSEKELEEMIDDEKDDDEETEENDDRRFIISPALAKES